MAKINFETLLNIKNDGLVFYGLTDDLEEFCEIINKELNDKEIGTGSFNDKFKSAYEIYTKDNRRDIVFEFNEKPKLGIGKLAIWRLQLNGLASWISDYVVNRRSDFGYAPIEDF